jgi:MFS family permease
MASPCRGPSTRKRRVSIPGIPWIQSNLFLYPLESKGATPIIYSSIFAIYELVMLITSLLFGNFVGRFRPNLMSGAGLTLTGLSTGVFGLLTYLSDQLPFISASFALRITESLGATAFATSSYSFIAACFPDRTGTMFSVMETCFGVGVITGPVLGGALYGVGGFLVPFAVVGVVMTSAGLLLVCPPVGRLFERGKRAGLGVSK